jgi:hypothetical protein
VQAFPGQRGALGVPAVDAVDLGKVPGGAAWPFALASWASRTENQWSSGRPVRSSTLGADTAPRAGLGRAEGCEASRSTGRRP